MKGKFKFLFFLKKFKIQSSKNQNQFEGERIEIMWL